jgi:hypothetical protein
MCGLTSRGRLIRGRGAACTVYQQPLWKSHLTPLERATCEYCAAVVCPHRARARARSARLDAHPAGGRAARQCAHAAAPGARRSARDRRRRHGVRAMAIRIKDTGALAKKFVQRAGAAGGDYKDGVAQAGATGKRTRARPRTTTKRASPPPPRMGGSARASPPPAPASTCSARRRSARSGFPSGVAASEGDWAKGVQPHLDAMKSREPPAAPAEGGSRRTCSARPSSRISTAKIRLGK